VSPPSDTHRCQCRGVWQEYVQSLESSWLLPDWLTLPTASRATQPGEGTEGSSRFTTFSKPSTLGSSLNVFSLVLTAVECSSLLSPYSSIQVYSNVGGFDELSFVHCGIGLECVSAPSVSISCWRWHHLWTYFRQKKVQHQLTARLIVFIRLILLSEDHDHETNSFKYDFCHAIIKISLFLFYFLTPFLDHFSYTTLYWIKHKNLLRL